MERHILSIDGGGVRGIIPLKTLEKINIKQNNWDMITGTSIGGIIAIALNFYTVQEVKFLIETNASKIFKSGIKNDILTGNGWIKAKYNFENLKEVLKDIFGNKSFKECKYRTLVTSWDLKNKKPKIFKSFQDDMLCSDVAYATAAAPTYFMPMKYFDKVYIDGGVFYNNPALIAALEANLIYKDDKISLLSLGTGKITKEIDIDNGGKAEWASKIIDVMMCANTEGVDYIIKNSYKNINYLRLQIDLEEEIELDDFRKIQELNGMGNAMYYRNVEKIINWKQNARVECNG